MTFNTVIFDFGGVITTSPFEAFNRMEAARGLPKDFVRSVNARNLMIMHGRSLNGRSAMQRNLTLYLPPKRGHWGRSSTARR